MAKKQSDFYQGNDSGEILFRRCTAFCIATALDLPLLLTSFHEKGIPFTEYRSGGGIIHRSSGANSDDIFYFSYGTVVMWGLSLEEERKVLFELKRFENETVESLDFEEYRYAMGSSAKIVGNDITLPSDAVFTKLAISHGLAQSVKLGVFEKRIEKRIQSTKYIPESLAIRGRIPLTRRAITRMMGHVFMDRSLVNLHSDILDTPEFFWEYSDLEPLYRLVALDLDIGARVKVLNKRMDILKELFEMLGRKLDSRYSNFLELTIIFLIFAEILIVLIREALG